MSLSFLEQKKTHWKKKPLKKNHKTHQKLSTSTSTSSTASTPPGCPPGSRGSTLSSSGKTPKVRGGGGGVSCPPSSCFFFFFFYCVSSYKSFFPRSSFSSLSPTHRRVLRPRARGRARRRRVPQGHHPGEVSQDRRVRLRDGLPQQPQKGIFLKTFSPPLFLTSFCSVFRALSLAQPLFFLFLLHRRLQKK